MAKNLQWFRLYHRVIDDEKIRLLAFEDRWHFIATCCLKAEGLLDEPESPLRDRKIAVKMGVQSRELDEIRRRLFEVGLTDENMHPIAWDELQFKSDTSTERVRNFRAKTMAKQEKRLGNVSVTAQDTDTDTDTDTEKEDIPADAGSLSGKYAFEARTIHLTWQDLERWKRDFPHLSLPSELWSLDEWAGKQNNWFVAVASALAKKERQATERINMARLTAETRERPRRVSGDGRI